MSTASPLKKRQHVAFTPKCAAEEGLKTSRLETNGICQTERGNLRDHSTYLCGVDLNVDKCGTMAGSRPFVIVKRSFALLQEEKNLFQSLLRFVAEKELEGTVLRAAGGWVRDKLLNRSCQDIDIALNNLTGERFLTQFNAWRVAQGLEGHTVGIIQRNPEQSKHLETATMSIDNFSLDFVNLRTEMYANGSRIPDSITFGTPEEGKAFLINGVSAEDMCVQITPKMRYVGTLLSTLYSTISIRMSLKISPVRMPCHSRWRLPSWVFCLEKTEERGGRQLQNRVRACLMSGRGLQDLKNRLLATPINAFITLKDDPLRLLRGVRFSSTLGLQLDPNFIEAARDPDVQLKLDTVVSRERVGQELSKMLTYGPPLRGLKILCEDLHAAKAVFKIPDTGKIFLKRVARVKKYMIAFAGLQLNNRDIDISSVDNEGRESWWRRGLDIVDLYDKDCAAIQSDEGNPTDAVGTMKLSLYKQLDLACQLNKDPDGQRRLTLACFLYPLREVVIKQAIKGSGTNKPSRKEDPLPFVIAYEGLKLKRRDADVLMSMIQGAQLWTQLALSWDASNVEKKSCLSTTPKSDCKDETINSGNWKSLLKLEEPVDNVWAVSFGLAVRRIGSHWAEALYLASLYGKVFLPDAALEQKLQEILQHVRSIIPQHQDILGLKPLLNGSEVKKILPLLPKGPLIQEVLHHQIVIQLSDASVDKDTMVQKVQTKFSKFTEIQQ